jgi:DNA-binding GntR family transcriptional regulator
LAERYDAGVIPLREALSRLSSTGFIIAEERRGFRVTDISAEEIIDVQTQRAELESIALRKSIERGDVHWEADVMSAHYKLFQFHKDLDDHLLAGNTEYEKLHTAFHLQLLSACGSQWLLRFITTLIEHGTRYRQIGLHLLPAKQPERNIAQEHKAIMEASLARDADLASALLKAHYRRTADTVLELIARSQPAAVERGQG